MVSDDSRFKNYEAKCARKPPSIKETGSFSDSTGPASEDGSEVSLDPDIGKHPVHTNPYLINTAPADETLGQIEILIGNAATCTTTCKPTLAARVKALTGAPAPAPSPPTDTDIRAELTAVTTLFLTPNSPKELNIPPSLREHALSALQTSTDPEALRPIADHVYLLLKNCSHRNFVRLGVSNGTYETVCVATGLGIVLTIAGFLYVLLRAFTGGLHSRYDAFGAWPMWFLGMTLVLSGLRGSCFFLLLFTRRQPLPWERFDDAASVTSQRAAVVRMLGRLMVFDRKFRVKDGGLREVQHRIVGQSMFGGAVFASLCVLVFIFLPVWRQTV